MLARFLGRRRGADDLLRSLAVSLECSSGTEGAARCSELSGGRRGSAPDDDGDAKTTAFLPSTSSTSSTSVPFALSSSVPRSGGSSSDERRRRRGQSASEGASAPPLVRRRFVRPRLELSFASSRPSSSLSSSRTRLYSTAAPSPRKLDDVMKLESLRDKTGDEIASIWTEFHRDDSKNRVGGTLSAEDYRSFSEHLSASPMFVWPLRKELVVSGEGRGGERKEEKEGERKEEKEGGGLLVLLSQAQPPHVLFTTVDEFRSLGPDAPAHVVVTHYRELAESKGVVLWRADVVSPALLALASTTSTKEDGSLSPSSSSSSEVARSLVAKLHALYADPEGRAHAKALNEGARGFDFNEVVRYFGMRS